jgi:hypothetical protein
MNKKAIIGDTLTWFLAFLVIFFILFIFEVIALNIAKTRSQFDVAGEINIKGTNFPPSVSLTNEFAAFLSTIANEMPLYEQIDSPIFWEKANEIFSLPCREYIIKTPSETHYKKAGEKFQKGFPLLAKLKDIHFSELIVYSKNPVKLNLMEIEKC